MNDKIILLEEFVYQLISVRAKYASEYERAELEQLVETYENLKEMIINE